ncbi:MAG: hypothetical protein M0R66_08500, partial [Candidatus Omnitrophica bacterium]|nr:hypothetical protein [Candidatus Omnitrophota bacterium]
MTFHASKLSSERWTFASTCDSTIAISSGVGADGGASAISRLAVSDDGDSIMRGYIHVARDIQLRARVVIKNRASSRRRGRRIRRA